jgi:G:T/U-mismatch repair DNA glycosylase
MPGRLTPLLWRLFEASASLSVMLDSPSEHVFFNGGKPETAFRRHVLPTLSDDRRTFHRLPSTSPAHAAMTLEAKLKAWSVVQEVLDHRERLEGDNKS